jgi:2-succinyl-5-enolpyruvyl-6-hydroxy-3-cyclohexene-1-carboxylate synthase
VRELANALPDDALLYVSNSMPVRDLDAFLPVSPRPLRVLCNRGANGIDGMISSALGAAAAECGHVVLLTGDLAFAHDLGGLLAAHRHGLRATVVLLNNDGGGIFSFLPIAAYGDAVHFEENFRTPLGVDFAPAAETFGVRFTRVGSWEHFRAALKESVSDPRTSVIEVPVDRDRSVAHHREIERAVGEALAGGRPLEDPR